MLSHLSRTCSTAVLCQGYLVAIMELNFATVASKIVLKLLEQAEMNYVNHEAGVLNNLYNNLKKIQDYLF